MLSFCLFRLIFLFLPKKVIDMEPKNTDTARWMLRETALSTYNMYSLSFWIHLN